MYIPTVNYKEISGMATVEKARGLKKKYIKESEKYFCFALFCYIREFFF